MSTSIKWNASASKEVSAVARPRWKQLRQGFGLAVTGQVWFLALALPGLLLLGPLGWRVARLCHLEADDTLALSLLLLGGGALVGYGLVLLGQWRCLTYAPQGHSAKELQFACLLCSLMAPPCFVAAYFLGGAELYPALAHDPSALRDVNLLSGAVVLPLAGFLLALTSALLFSGYARAVARYLKDADCPRRVTAYFWFVLFLLAGTAGLLPQARRSSRLDVWVVLVAAWLVCLAWHALLIRGAGRAIARVLAQAKSGLRPAVAVEGRKTGHVALRAAAYFGRSEEDWG
jgi:hypothetical protein